MQLPNDAQLVVMARKPPGELFPAFRETGPFTPLLMLLCFLPGLYALLYAAGSDADALWGLRAIDLVSGDWPDSLWKMPEEGPESALRWQPPLGPWVTAAVIRLASHGGPFLLRIPSFLAVAAAVAMILLAVRAVGSERFGLWTVVLAAAHAPLLTHATRIAPVALGIALALSAFWGFLSHLNAGTRRISVKLLLGGIALGLCSLAAGPLAVGVFVALALYVLGLRGESLSKKQYAEPRRIRVWSGWPAMRSLLVLAAIGLTCGGFWTVALWWSEGVPFLTSWVLGTPAPDAAGEALGSAAYDSRPLWEVVAQRLLFLQGPLLPASVSGLVMALWGVARSHDERRRRLQLFLAAWVIAAAISWVPLLRRNAVLPFSTERWECFLSLSLVACAAHFLEEVSLRHVRVRAVAAILALGVLLLWLAARHFGSLQLLAMSRVLLVAAACGIVMVGVNSLREERGDRDSRQQVILASLVLSLIAASAATGIASLRRTTPDDRALLAFQKSLPVESKVSHGLVISGADNLPLRLRLAVESAWPGIRLESADSWDAAFTRVLALPREESAAIVIDWGRPESSAPALRIAGIRVTQNLSPQFFEGGPLRSFLLTRESENAPDEETGVLAGTHGAE